jgi:hypothetical protein
LLSQIWTVSFDSIGLICYAFVIVLTFKSHTLILMKFIAPKLLAFVAIAALCLISLSPVSAQEEVNAVHTSILAQWKYEGEAQKKPVDTKKVLLADAEEKPVSRSSYAGFYLGQRRFANVPEDVFLRTGDSSLSLVDLGKGTPLALGLGFMFQPEENGLAVPFWIDGFLGNTSGIGFGVGIGYKLGNAKFSFTPNLTVGLGRIWTAIDVVNIDSTIVPAGFFEPGNNSIFVGRGVTPDEVGGGSNLFFSLGSAFFHAKLSANVSGRITEKMFLFADIGYNLVYASTRNKFEVSGQGYGSFDDLLALETPPEVLSVELEGQGIVNNQNEPYEKTPYNLSGLAIHVGVGFRLD